MLSDGVSTWQGRNWDPSVNDARFDTYCAKMESDQVLYPETQKKREAVEELLRVGGYGDHVPALTNRMLNYIGWVRANHQCGPGETQDECLSQFNYAFYRKTDISQTWRSWPYQYCTQ